MQHLVVSFTLLIYEFEDSQALGLIATCLESGTSDPYQIDSRPTYVPSEHFLSLIGTIVVHPTMTNRATSPEKSVAADQALQLLRNVNKLVGARNANLQAAFAYTAQNNEYGARIERRTKRTLAKQEPAAIGTPSRGLSDAEEEPGDVRTPMARRTSLWSRAESFWHMVGWAFNCSINCTPRWVRWRLWLEYMLEVLEDDWNDRSKAAQEAYPKTGREAEVLKESMIMQYLQDTRFAGRSGRRNIMTAIFARGQGTAVNLFREIWAKETEVKVKKQPAATRTKVNLDEGQFGDYFEDEEDEDMGVKSEMVDGSRVSSRQKTARRSTPAPMDADEDDDDASDYGLPAFGGYETLILRRRFLVLVRL